MSHGFIYVVDAHFIDKIVKKNNNNNGRACAPDSSANKTYRYNITEILLKVALNIKPGMSIDFEVAGEIWKVAGKLMRTAQPSDAQSPLYGLGAALG